MAPVGLTAQSLSIASGNGQIVLEQFRANAPMVVQARNASGSPLAGVGITWSISPNIGGLTEQVTTTDSNGLASAMMVASSPPPGYSIFAGTVTASSSIGTATFQVTITAVRQPNGQLGPPPLVQLVQPTLEDRTITGAAGGAVPGGVQVRVIVQSGPQSGMPVPNVGVRLVDGTDITQPSTASCNGPAGTVLTDATGLARCDVILPGTIGTITARALAGELTATPTFDIATTVGSACSYSLSSTSQSFSSAGGASSFSVNTGASCGWLATTAATWIAISGGSGTGTGTVSFTVASNSGPARTGTIQVGGQTFTISQSAVGTAPNPLTITTTSLPSGSAGSPYSVTLAATGGQPPYRWSVSGSLPSGMGLNATTGTLSGTPAAAGTYAFTVTVTDALGGGKSQNFVLNIAGQNPGGGGGGPGSLAIATDSFPNGSVGVEYSQSIVLTGGCSSPFFGGPRVSLSSGALPPGLQLASNRISGTPTTAGSFNFALLAEDACLTRVTRNYTIVIGGTGGTPGVMSVTPSSLSFQIRQGQVEPPAASTLTLGAATPVDFTVTANTSTGGNWLAVTPASGRTPGAVSAGLQNFSGLAAGNYTGRISIGSTATNSPVAVNVTLVVTPASTLTVNPNSLTFSLEQGSSEQVLAVTGTNGASFQAWASTSLGGDWLRVTPSNGRLPSTVTVRAAVGSLARGSYSGAVTLTPEGGVAVTVPVTLNVIAAPELSAFPLTLTFIYQAGVAPPAAQTIQTHTSTGNLPYEVVASTSNGGPWLFTSPGSAVTPEPVSVSVNPLTLSPGTYQGAITIRSPQSPRTITVNVLLNILPATPAINAVTNAASFLEGAVAPGEIITIFGSNLGPSDLVGPRVAGGRLGAELADTRVLFDDEPAPLIYVSETQLSAIVPYRVANRERTSLRVERFGARSAARVLNVTPAAPGLFMIGGTNQAAAVNQNGTVNSPDNAADRGSIISLYATGEGQTDPAGDDGKIAVEPLPKPVLPVTVRIGGQVAEILYAGAAPQLPAGVIQINARIPENVEAGAVPVFVAVGAASSQEGATIAVK
jgi:uncharacterized protein (TIGR03437 family)